MQPIRDELIRTLKAFNDAIFAAREAGQQVKLVPNGFQVGVINKAIPVNSGIGIVID